MNESGNIMQHDFSFIRQEKESTGMMYVEFIGKLQQTIDELQKEKNGLTIEAEKLKNLVTILKKHNDQLIEDNKELSANLELEKAHRQQLQQQLQQHAPNAHGNKPLEYDVKTSSVASKRKGKPQAINPDTIRRLKNDRRHYAVACDKALSYWQMLVDNELVDQYLRATPRCGVTVAARIVCCFQNVVDPDIRWSFFEKYWGMKHLQSNLNRSTYRDEKKYALVNRIFGRSDDAPFIPKSQLTDI